MSVKDGAAHVRSLRDGRSIFLDGERVEDHASHPAFRNAVQSAASLYDLQASPEHIERMTFRSPTTGDSISRIWELPTSLGELIERRRALTRWAEMTCGMLGRSPDHVASALCGMYMGLDLYQATNPERAAALSEYYQFARDRDLYLSYVIVNPQGDRASGTGGGSVACAVCDEDSSGITLKGAKMLGTAIPLANELMVGAIQPLKSGDEKLSFTAMVPLNAPGLKLFSRRSYEAAAPSLFDYPLSSRFDENDCVVYFDEVRVSWDRVFVYDNVKMASDQWHAIPTHVYQNYQCQIRLMVKLKFLVGLARRIAETNGVLQVPAVRENLGFLSSQVSMVEAMVCAMESRGTYYRQYWVPDRAILYASQVLTQQLYPDFVRAIRDLAGGGLIMLPSSSADLTSDETRDLVLRVQHSPVTDSIGRIKLMKLAWDAIGSEFGSRHLQYEMFYAGSSMVTRAHAYRTFDWDHSLRLVDTLMSSYAAPALIDDANRALSSA